MSVSFSIYAIDEEELGKVLGSSNQVLYEELLAEKQDEIDEINSFSFDSDSSDHGSVENALKALINGNWDTANKEAGLEFALELICSFIGDEPESEVVMECGPSYLEDYPELYSLIYTSTYFPLPHKIPSDEYSYIGGISKSRLDETIQLLKKAMKEDDNLEEDIEEIYESYIELLENAKEQKKSIISFSYV